MPALPAAEARGLVAAARVGRLATVTAAGAPHVVPVCFAVEADTIWSAVDSKPKRTHELLRLANVRATGRAALLADVYDEDWSQLRWARADAAARIVEDPAERARALAALAAKYEQYRCAPPQGAVLALAVERWSGWRASPAAG